MAYAWAIVLGITSLPSVTNICSSWDPTTKSELPISWILDFNRNIFSRCDGLCLGNCTWHHITAICDKRFDMEGVWLRAIKAWMDLLTFCLCSWHVLWMALHWFTKLLCTTNFSGMYFRRFPHCWYVLKSKQLETIEDLNFSFYIQCLFFQQFI